MLRVGGLNLNHFPLIWSRIMFLKDRIPNKCELLNFVSVRNQKSSDTFWWKLAYRIDLIQFTDWFWSVILFVSFLWINFNNYLHFWHQKPLNWLKRKRTLSWSILLLTYYLDLLQASKTFSREHSKSYYFTRNLATLQIF